MTMNSISIFGLGYVGTVTAACFASRGYRVIGVDPNPQKIQRIQAGASPIVENGLEEMITSAKRANLISATHDPFTAITESDVSIISVGTPSQRNGRLDLSHVRNVCSDIGLALKSKKSIHLIVLRSTVLPGTSERVVLPAIEEASGKKAGHDFMFCFNPEFLREGSAVTDFFHPPFTVIGTSNPAQTSTVRELYRFISAPLYETEIAVAEMIKYSSNAFHALKVAFANEIGTICRSMGVDPKKVADIFKSDVRLNISSAYLNPGFAFGGSCLPKDVRALTQKGRELDLKLPLLDSILPSNVEHIDRAAEAILSLSKRKVGVLGLSFKSGTDDLRDSPMVHLVKKLIAEGCEVEIWDENVLLGRLIGSNRQFIEEYIPHIGTLLRSNIETILARAEIVILGTNALRREEIIERVRDGQYFMDVTRLEVPLLKKSLARRTAVHTTVGL
jgi:GDP-mannose 6-dehydrogenase